MEKSLRVHHHEQIPSDIAYTEDNDAITKVASLNEDSHVGTVNLFIGDETVLLPTPSPDPKDPLNLPTWRKWAALVLISIFGVTCIMLASGMGPIITAVRASYPGQEEKTNDLLTYPALFMGIGNMLAMPFTNVIGRRPIFLASSLLIIVTCVWCQHSQSLDSHIAGRNVMALAAGQSEALLPMMIQEIFFLHQRGRMLAWFAFIENVLTAVFFMTSPYMVTAWTWRGWYAFFAVFNGVSLLASIFLVSETYFIRPDDAATGKVHLKFNAAGQLDEEGQISTTVQATTKHGMVLEPEKYGPRTWRSGLQLWSKFESWGRVPQFYLDFAKGLVHPLMFWLLLINGAYLGLYVFQASTFATILMSPPYLFPFNSLGYVQGSQIFVCLVFLPLLGYGSDWVIRLMSKRNRGVYRPEYRLPLFAIPAIAGVVCAIIYGKVGAHPTEYHWMGIAFTYSVIFFAFLGANLMGITYALDSFPLKAAPMLAVICAGRGFISFGLSFAVLPAVTAVGYDGSMTIVGSICAGLAALTIPAYFFGPALRRLGQKYYGFGESKHSHRG